MGDWTPGPWRVEEKQIGQSVSTRVVSRFGGVIALIKTAGGDKEANSHLIASAPLPCGGQREAAGRDRAHHP